MMHHRRRRRHLFLFIVKCFDRFDRLLLLLQMGPRGGRGRRPFDSEILKTPNATAAVLLPILIHKYRARLLLESAISMICFVNFVFIK